MPFRIPDEAGRRYKPARRDVALANAGADDVGQLALGISVLGFPSHDLVADAVEVFLPCHGNCQAVIDAGHAHRRR
jgi:hypothetical protein